MKVVLFFLAIAAVIGGIFWYANQQGVGGEAIEVDQENCDKVTEGTDEEYSISYGDRIKQVAGGCI